MKSSSMVMRPTRVVCLPSVKRMFITVESEWLTKYVRQKAGNINDCYIVEITRHFGALQLLESDVMVIKLRMRSFLKRLIACLSCSMW